MSTIEDWYDEVPPDPDRPADGDFYDEPQSRLDMSRVPSKFGGLPIDPDLAAILAGQDGLASKPDAAAIALGLVQDLRALGEALLAGLGGDWGPLTTWLTEHRPEWLPDLTGWVPNIGADLAGLKAAIEGTYTGDDDVLQAIQSAVGTLRALAGGRIKLSQLGKIPLSLLTAGNNNELGAGLFGSADTINDPTGRWWWDEAAGRTTAGCARTTGDGTETRLNSEPRDVDDGEPVQVGVWVEWSGVTAAAGEAFRLQVRAFDAAGALVSTSTVAAVSSPAGSAGWTQLSGTWTAPAGVVSVRVQLVVTANVTAGEIGWDDGTFTRTRTSLPQQWISGLAEALTNLGDWIEAVVNQLLGALGVPALGTLFDKISDLSDEIEGWFGDTQDRAAELADLIGDLLSNPGAVLGDLAMGKITGLASSLAAKAETTVVAAVQQFILDLANAILSAIRKVPVVGGTIADRIEDVVDDLGGLKDQADGTKAGIVAGWTGGSSSGADADVYDTVSDIRAAVLSGYTVEIKTSSGTWTKPSEITELAAILVGGGQAGANGGSGSLGPGGAGGDSGGFLAYSIDPASVGATVSVTVAAAGGVSSFGSYTSAAGAGGLATQFGYSATSSTPGGGGNGGTGASADTAAAAGVPGGSSAVAPGGTAGSGGATNGGGTNGGDGTAVSAGAVTKCGGSGGGGGGGAGRRTNFGSHQGGNGGIGAYPGGGGGGGGGGSSGITGGSANPGSGGAGAAGCVWIFYR